MQPENSYQPPNFDQNSQPQRFNQPEQPQPWTPPVMHAPATPQLAQQPAEPELTSTEPGLPVPVVKVLSVHGVEYAMMTFALWASAFTMGWALISLINHGSSFDDLIVPVSTLITTLPVFGLLFIRLRSAEISKPALRMDASKRRWSQATQLIAFITCLTTLSIFVYVLLRKVSGNSDTPIGKTIGDLAIIFVLAGGLLAYYWFDEHRAVKVAKH